MAVIGLALSPCMGPLYLRLNALFHGDILFQAMNASIAELQRVSAQQQRAQGTASKQSAYHSHTVVDRCGRGEKRDSDLGNNHAELCLSMRNSAYDLA